MKPVFRYSLCLFCFALFLANGAETAGGPSGIYKTIDIRLEKDTIKSLHESKGQAQAQVIKGITDKPAIYSPPVFYFLSSVLFDEGKKDDAMFWFYAGQLRGRIDANICADKSAKPAIDYLNSKFGGSISEYAFTDIHRLTNTVEKVLAWEQITPYTYDRRWINLHGMQTLTGDTNSPLSVPKSQWETIRKTSRDNYRSSFYKALAQRNANKH